MAEQCCVQGNGFKKLEPPEPEIEWREPPEIVASPCRERRAKDARLLLAAPACVRLDLEDLKCFEVVDRQFEKWGVTFNNAVAINPSNPAFPPHSGTTVLIGAPKSGFLEVTFSQPVRSVSGFVTSSRRAVLVAYEGDSQPAASAEIPGPNLAGSDSPIPPNAQLSVRAKNICRVTFLTFDGHLTVGDLSFVT
ncbi:hypothetical protein [Kamptonema formosum]|uniref:hypothetical protein n=1 Tax=Kamptonema formosum TaxID=331992 RepID=UPI00034AE0F5|nr:hypothetical protein [Oscillatoria sp. PCC 10802]